MGAPQLNIKDAETTAMVRQLAELTGETQTEVVRKAVKQRLEREQHLREPASVRSEDSEIADLRAFLARCRDEMRPYSPSENDGMYDEFGAPI
jgi:antitoxin VapB